VATGDPFPGSKNDRKCLLDNLKTTDRDVCARQYLALKVVLGKLRQLRSEYSFIGTAFLNSFLVELVEAQVGHPHRWYVGPRSQ